MTDTVKSLPVEVELALDVMPCQAMRRSYDGAPQPHACAHFAEWGVLHSYDYEGAGPPAGPGIVQQSVYAGKRPVVPEILSGCRKAPILAVGINPNLPGWQARDRNAIHPYFDDYLQYAHYFRWRARDKLRIPQSEYDTLLAGREDGPSIGTPLIDKGKPIDVELSPVTMYRQYQTLLDGLAERQGWHDHHLAVGEDLAYANMVACGGARWTTQLRPGEDDMPLMGEARARLIVDECFNKRMHFPRQLLHSLPAAVIVFSQTTADAFIARLGRHFTTGNPVPGEKLASLLKREIRMKLGEAADGSVIDTRVIFSPHASSNPQDFAEARAAIIGHLSDEATKGRLTLNAATGHLGRGRGGCQFCENALYSIGPCDYRDELRPLAAENVILADAAAEPSTAAERNEHLRLLADFMAPPITPAMSPSSDAGILDDAAPSAPRLALRGKVATMRGSDAILDNGTVYLHRGVIVGVHPADAPPPPGFADVVPIDSGGVIFPGLADLHNHLAYNILSLWWPQRALGNRAQWLRDRDYKAKVGMVMDVVAKRQDLLRALVRYVEGKLLMGGVTSGQGMQTKYGGKTLFQGLVRNFEGDNDPALVEVRHKITDLKSTEIVDFGRALASGAPMFFHLAEGTDANARAQFTMLTENHLVAPNLVGIHSLGLTPDDMAAFKAQGAGVIWSPLSNSLLYGRTIDPALLIDTAIPFALGSDWTPSGSRNILCEMKVAWLTAQASTRPIGAERLAQAVTRDAMRLAQWDNKLGTIEAGKYADLTIVAERGDGYESLLHATEADVRLVVVAGHARYGDAALMAAATGGTASLEPITVKGQAKAFNLDHPSSPLNGISMADATRALAAALADLPAARAAAAFTPLDDGPQIEIELEMPEVEAEAAGEAGDFDLLAEVSLPTSVPLDPLTVIDDDGYWATIDAISHLPPFLKGPDGLRKFYTP
ncbi:hypothetical protein BH10PSE14_BH10PSE14_30750 [soil metagenome]